MSKEKTTYRLRRERLGLRRSDLEQLSDSLNTNDIRKVEDGRGSDDQNERYAEALYTLEQRYEGLVHAGTVEALFVWFGGGYGVDGFSANVTPVKPGMLKVWRSGSRPVDWTARVGILNAVARVGLSVALLTREEANDQVDAILMSPPSSSTHPDPSSPPPSPDAHDEGLDDRDDNPTVSVAPPTTPAETIPPEVTQHKPPPASSVVLSTLAAWLLPYLEASPGDAVEALVMRVEENIKRTRTLEAHVESLRRYIRDTENYLPTTAMVASSVGWRTGDKSSVASSAVEIAAMNDGFVERGELVRAGDHWRFTANGRERFEDKIAPWVTRLAGETGAFGVHPVSSTARLHHTHAAEAFKR